MINNIIAEKGSSDKDLLDFFNGEKAAIYTKRENFKINLKAIQEGQPIIQISQDNYKYFDESGKFIPQRLGEEVLSILTIKKGPNEGLFYFDNCNFEPAEQIIKQLISQLLGNKYTQWAERDTLSYLKSYLSEINIELNGLKKVFPKLTCLSSVKPEKVSWLWEPYLPIGKITLLEGDPGQGKTFFALAIAAAVSNGWPLIGKDGAMSQRTEPGRVLYMTAEDGLGDTLRPRLEKMDANLNNIIALEGKYETGKEELSLISLQDVEDLRKAFEMSEPSLVIIDPIQGFLGPDVNMNRAEEIRPLMSGLMKLVEEFKSAVLIIRHLTKSGKDKAAYRGMGSIDFTGAARSVLLVGKNPDNEAERVMIHTKSNLAEYGKSIGFQITNDGFKWLGHSDITAAQVLAPERLKDPDERDRTPIQEARQYLIDALEDGPKPAKELINGAKYSGFSIRTLKTAKAELKIESYREGDIWFWSFPNDAKILETS